jgi:hypothetical protein
MNLMLHGIDADPCPIVSGKDSLAGSPSQGDRTGLVLMNPPVGEKSRIAIVNEESDLEKEVESYERPDFWTSTKNKQLNFLQHVVGRREARTRPVSPARGARHPGRPSCEPARSWPGWGSGRCIRGRCKCPRREGRCDGPWCHREPRNGSRTRAGQERSQPSR